jgi:hypothetical protein
VISSLGAAEAPRAGERTGSSRLRRPWRQGQPPELPASVRRSGHIVGTSRRRREALPRTGSGPANHGCSRGKKRSKMKRAKSVTAREYLRVVEWSPKDRCFVGSAPPLIGRCCHGPTEANVLRQLKRLGPPGGPEGRGLASTGGLRRVQWAVLAARACAGAPGAGAQGPCRGEEPECLLRGEAGLSVGAEGVRREPLSC